MNHHSAEPVNNYTISQFIPEEVQAYKTMRLEALRLEPGMFGNSHAIEAAFADDQWLARVSNPDGACFGLYCGDELIGITGIVISDKERPEEAYMTQSYIRNAHRGKGLSRMLYEARLAWARKQKLKRLVIGHRIGNTASYAANQHYGFRFTHKESRMWPDGKTEDMMYYELSLLEE
jgi:RimJ/RimL family protein N-acetyltransferase